MLRSDRRTGDAGNHGRSAPLNDGRRHTQSAPADEVARIIGPFLPDADPVAVTAAAAAYQATGTWAGDAAIDRPLYDATVTLFQRHDALTADPPYEFAIAPIPPPR